VLRDRFLANSASSRTNVLCTKCLYLKALKPLAQVWYTGGGAFGRWLGHEDLMLMNGFSVLVNTEGSLTLLLLCEDITWKRTSPEPDHAVWHSDLSLPASRTVKN
jgi:hypothetical protein